MADPSGSIARVQDEVAAQLRAALGEAAKQVHQPTEASLAITSALGGFQAKCDGREWPRQPGRPRRRTPRAVS